MRTSIAVIMVLTSLPVSLSAFAGGSYVLPDGINRAPAVTLHCVASNGTAVACGTASSPLVVTSTVGASSAANQQQQITAEQASAQAIGTIGDVAFAGGQGSVVALLKALWSATSAGIPALPAGGMLTSRSVTLVGGVSVQVFAPNLGRKYVSFQVPQATGVWINVMGGVAAPNGLDCAYFAAGTFYESGQFINRGAIAVYAPANAVFSAWEG